MLNDAFIINIPDIIVKEEAYIECNSKLIL